MQLVLRLLGHDGMASRDELILCGSNRYNSPNRNLHNNSSPINFHHLFVICADICYNPSHDVCNYSNEHVHPGPLIRYTLKLMITCVLMHA